MSYIVVDVETANADYASICQIGLVEVKDGEIVAREALLIDPDDYFDDFNISIHGIGPDRVSGSRTFPEIHTDLSERLKGKLIVHHGPFDRVAFARACSKAQVNDFDCQWLDNQRVVRRAWEQFQRSGYALRNLADHFGIQLNHHDALEDAIATHEIFKRALAETGTIPSDWTRMGRRISALDRSQISGKGDENGPFAGETIVFTGSLVIHRDEASKIAKKLGFSVGSGVTKRTTVLCAGVQDRNRLGGYEKTSKHRKAEALAEAGHSIRILSEDDFWSLVPRQLRPPPRAPRPQSHKRMEQQGTDLVVTISLEDLFSEDEIEQMLRDFE